MSSYSIGVIIYNEELNLKSLFKSLLNQKLSSGNIEEVIVIASGCTDNTVDVVNQFKKIDSRIKLICQNKRLGKPAAINDFLNVAKNKICIVINGDTVLKPTAVDYLVKGLKGSNVGMVGARPIPRVKKETFITRICKIMWKLHHYISLNSPKLGELIGISKDVVSKIPEDTVVDEVIMEYMVKKRGFKLKYIPSSVVYIRVPTSWKDFIKQRRRIAVGHLEVEKKIGYNIPTRGKLNILKIIIGRLINIKNFYYLLAAILLEGISRTLAVLDYYVKEKKPYIWSPVTSTKDMPGKEIEESF